MQGLGIDIGSSSVKVSVFDLNSGKVVGSGQYPDKEMKMIAHQSGWAEQDPEWWWEAFRNAYKRACNSPNVHSEEIQSIGISYQMHGLVCLDKSGQVIRPSIIWCDSRAVGIGKDALRQLGEDYSFNHLLNSPGNFTASKLKWVKENEPELYNRIDKICLPGDYIGYRLTNRLTTTISGMSEGIFYDFKAKKISKELLSLYGFSESIIPELRESFDDHGRVSQDISKELGISSNALLSYKSGDQPNNALSLNVLRPGEIAATAGTSGVVYGVSDDLFIDYSQRVNSFAHVNYTKEDPRIGILLCINGTGISNSWAHKWTKAESYPVMNDQAETIAPGSDGLIFIPFGNGAERMLNNANPGAGLFGINFNIHTPAHLYRSVQEGIAYSFMYGMEAFIENDIDLKVIRAGHANMFLSPLFAQTLSTLSGVNIELYNTDGAAGAARGGLIGAGIAGVEDVFSGLQKIKTYTPDANLRKKYPELYQRWKKELKKILNKE